MNAVSALNNLSNISSLSESSDTSDAESSKMKFKRKHNDSLNDQVTKKNSKSLFSIENENSEDQLETSIEIENLDTNSNGTSNDDSNRTINNDSGNDTAIISSKEIESSISQYIEKGQLLTFFTNLTKVINFIVF